MEIKNDCAQLPKGVLRHVRRGLGWIHPADLQGVGLVRLIDKTPTDLVLHFKKRGAADTTQTTLAFYMRAEKNTPARIVVIVPRVIREIPGWMMRTPAPTLLFARVLAHEVGHHLIEQRGYALHPTEKPARRLSEYEEEMVDRYAFEVLRRMKRRFRYKLGQWLIDELAGWRNAQGRAAWESGAYVEARDLFLAAFRLKPDDVDNEKCYRIAQARVEKESSLITKR